MHDLVAVELPGGDAFVSTLAKCWEAGDAVAPISTRLAPPARRQLLEVLAPDWLVRPEGWSRLPGGRPVRAGDALVMATSGSTGLPKGVVLTHEAVAASAFATSARLNVDPSRHRWLACLPLEHIGGLSVVTRALLTGTALEVHDGFDTTKAMAAAGPQVMVSLVATALQRLDARAFRTVVLGGSAPPDELPANAVTTYGMTETGSGVVYDGVPLEGVDVAISGAGEVLVRGPMLLRAYRDGSIPLDADGWLATGDAGHTDSGGRLHVDGRMTDMLVTGGENVWPVPVERLLCRHPGVREAALSSVPDPEWGDLLVACVVPTDPAAPPLLEELRELVKSHLAAYAAPKRLVLVPELPKTALGKLQRRALHRLVASGG